MDGDDAGASDVSSGRVPDGPLYNDGAQHAQAGGTRGRHRPHHHVHQVPAAQHHLLLLRSRLQYTVHLQKERYESLTSLVMGSDFLNPKNTSVVFRGSKLLGREQELS